MLKKTNELNLIEKKLDNIMFAVREETKLLESKATIENYNIDQELNILEKKFMQDMDDLEQQLDEISEKNIFINPADAAKRSFVERYIKNKS